MSNTPRVKITSAENPRCSAFDFLAQAKSAPSWGTHWWLHDGYVWKDGSCQTCVPHVQHGHEKVIQKHTTVLFWIVQPYSKPTQVDSYILRRRLREFISRNSAKLSRTFGRRDTSLCALSHTWSRFTTTYVCLYTHEVAIAIDRYCMRSHELRYEDT